MKQLATLVATLIIYFHADAQVLKNVTNKAKQKIEQKADQKTDKAIEDAVDGKKKSGEENKEETNSEEQKKEAALRLVTPHRIVCKHQNVSTPDRNVNHGRRIRQLRASRKHAANEQFLFIRGKSHHNARSLGQRCIEGSELKSLFLCQFCRIH